MFQGQLNITLFSPILDQNVCCNKLIWVLIESVSVGFPTYFCLLLKIQSASFCPFQDHGRVKWRVVCNGTRLRWIDLHHRRGLKPGTAKSEGQGLTYWPTAAPDSIRSCFWSTQAVLYSVLRILCDCFQSTATNARYFKLNVISN